MLFPQSKQHNNKADSIIFEAHSDITIDFTDLHSNSFDWNQKKKLLFKKIYFHKH